MTRVEIEQLSAGPEMDGLLAETFMDYPYCIGGAKRRFVVHDGEPIWLAGPQELPTTCPRYSTDPKAAFELATVLNKTHLLEVSQYWATGGSLGGTLGFQARFTLFRTGSDPDAYAKGNKVADAIGRAALLSKFCNK